MIMDYEDETDDRPSKSERKREMHRLQALGEKLIGLKDEELAQLPISEPLQAAVLEMRRIKAHEGKRRHLQYIGRLMRNENPEPIVAALEKLTAGSIAQKRQLHEIEHWRERLIEQGNSALAEFIDAHPSADRQLLNQLIRSANKERDQEKAPAASRKLFKLLRQILEAEMH
jgi:ribosome-associated protein